MCKSATTPALPAPSVGVSCRLLGVGGIWLGGALDGVSDKLRVEHRSQSKGVMDAAFLILRRHLLIVTKLRQHNANEQWVALCACHKHGTATVAAERSKIRQISVMRLDGQERMAGDDALPGHGEARIVGLETLGIREYKKRAANRSEERRVGKECRSRWSP